MLCCRRGSKEDENTTLVAGREGSESRSDKCHRQQQQPASVVDGRSSGDGDSDDHFPPYGSGANDHFNVGFHQQQHQQNRGEEFALEDASTWRRQTTSTFFGDDKESSLAADANSASLSSSYRQTTSSRLPTASNYIRPAAEEITTWIPPLVCRCRHPHSALLSYPSWRKRRIKL